MQHERRWRGCHKHMSVSICKQKWFLGQGTAYYPSSRRGTRKPGIQDRPQHRKPSHLNAWLRNKNYKPPAFFLERKELSKGNNLAETLGRSGNTKERPQ